MRFIFNFIFFGILFYLIYLFFPDAFKTLVSWADQIVSFFKELFTNLWHKYQTPTPAPAPTHALLFMLPLMFKKK